MKRIFLVVIAVLLVAVLIFSGCAKEPAGPEPGESFELTILPLFAGSTAYVVGNIVSTCINEESTWLKTTCPESKGDIINVKELVSDPSKRPNTIFFVSSLAFWAGEEGIEPMNEPPFSTYDYSEFKYLWFCAYGSGAYVTTNPNIKTFYDLNGQNINLASERYGSKATWMRKMFELAGIKVNEFYIGNTDAASRLTDGALDAIYVTTTLDELPDKHNPSGWFQEVITTRDVYGVSFPKKEFDMLKAEWPNFPEKLTSIAPYSIDDVQVEPLVGVSQHMAFACHESLPDEVVTEVLTILYGHVNELREYKSSQKIVSDKTMGGLGVPDEQIHPAALKFYRDRGMSTKDIVEFTKADTVL